MVLVSIVNKVSVNGRSSSFGIVGVATLFRLCEKLSVAKVYLLGLWFTVMLLAEETHDLYR
jgi:hypothetical protein